MSNKGIFLLLWVVITLLAIDQSDVSKSSTLIACVIAGGIFSALLTCIVWLIQKAFQ